MATQVQFRRGNTSDHSTFTGVVGEVTVDIDKDTVVIHDGSTAGGHPLMKEDGSNSAIALGSAASPALKFTGDTNTGIYSPGADQLAISTGGTGRLFIDSSGNVGIGTSSPSTTLDVQGTSVKFTGTNGNTLNLYRSGSGTQEVAVNFYDPSSNRVKIWNTGGNLAIATNGVSEKVRIDSSGNVGIGTTSADAPLDVRAGSYASNQDAGIQLAVSGGQWKSGLKIKSDGSGIPRLSLDAMSNSTGGTTEVLSMVGGSNVGNVGIGTTSPSRPLVVSNAGAEGFEFWPGSGGSGFNTLNHYDRSAAGYVNVRTNADQHIFGRADGEKMRIDSSGNVGIGTTSPNSTLHVAGNLTITKSSNNPAIVFDEHSGSTDPKAQIQMDQTNSTNASLLFFTEGSGTLSERMRIDSSGNVGIGTTSPGGKLHVESAATTAGWQIRTDSVGLSNESGFYRDASDHYELVLRNGAGGLSFLKNDGGASTANLTFNVQGSERMRISSSGTLLVNTTSTEVSSSEKLTAKGISTFYRHQGSVINVKRIGNNGDVINFLRDTTTVGTISVTTSATSYNTSSDYRLKENVVDITDAITRVKQLAPKRFNFIANPDIIVDGFLAHEAQTVVPEAVTGTHNEVDDDGNPVMQGIDQSKLVPLLTAALQEAIAEIETLKTKVAALEAG